MNALAAQQQALQHAITAKAAAPGLLYEHADREPLLRIYQQAYEARLTSALRDNFGVLPFVMGGEAFDALACGYIAAQPSRHPSIRWFGDRLAEFMDSRDDLVPHPAFADLARMEWALRAAFDAADATPIAADQLAAQPPEQWPSLVFELHASVRVITLDWAIEPVWRALQDFDPASGSEPDLPEPEQHAHALAVWRNGLETRWRAVDPVQSALLNGAGAGRSISELCVLAAERVGDEQAAATAVGALHQWLADGLLVGLRQQHPVR
jgi:hypothetical protein